MRQLPPLKRQLPSHLPGSAVVRPASPPGSHAISRTVSWILRPFPWALGQFVYNMMMPASRTRFKIRWQCGSSSTPITRFGLTTAPTRSITSPSVSS